MKGQSTDLTQTVIPLWIWDSLRDNLLSSFHV